MRWTVTGVNLTNSRIQPWMLYAAAVDLFVADRLLKFFVLRWPEAPVDGPLAFALFKNTGIIFSLPLPALAFWPLAVVALGLIGLVIYRLVGKSETVLAGIGLFILLGAVSNLLDRALYGGTIDYLIFFRRSVVNLADGMILGGVVALSLLQRRSERIGLLKTV